MRTTLLAASLVLLTACGGAIAPTSGDPNGQGPTSGGGPGAGNPSNPSNPSGSNPGGNPGNPTQPDPAQPGDPGATASVTGTVNGAPFTFSSVTAMRQSSRSSNGGYLFVVMSNRAFSCADLQAANANNETFANLNVLMVGVAALQASPVTAGTYAIGGASSSSSQEGLAIVESSDATCNFTNSQAQAGSVTFDTLTADQVSGEFRADFGGGQQLTGSFAVPVCDLGVPNDAQSGTPACLP